MEQLTFAINALGSGEQKEDKFVVTVNDGSNASDTKNLTINLLGVNDIPVVTPTSFSILENTANNVILGKVVGSDIESPSPSSWTIISGNTDINNNGKSAFAIDSTGQIKVNDSGDLDFETQKKFVLQVTASDGSATSNPASVTVNLLDQLEFTSGDDIGKGTPGKDIMDALDGNDILYGYDGDDFLFGGNGIDNIYGGNGNDLVNGGDGNDRLYGESGDDIIDGEAGADILQGGDGNDVLNGGNDSDRLFGDNGNDVLNAGDGADILYGGAGDDILTGGLGSDRYYGEAGKDTFVIGLGQGQDIIYDYEKGIDKIKVLNGITTYEQKSGSNVLIKSDTEILATVYNVGLDQISYVQPMSPA